MAQLEELEDSRSNDVVDGELVMEPAFYEDGDNLFADFTIGVNLMKRAYTIISFLADKNLCKQLSSRERATLVKVAASLEEYIMDVTPAIKEMEE